MSPQLAIVLFLWFRKKIFLWTRCCFLTTLNFCGVVRGLLAQRPSQTGRKGNNAGNTFLMAMILFC